MLFYLFSKLVCIFHLLTLLYLLSFAKDIKPLYNYYYLAVYLYSLFYTYLKNENISL